jgi:hypothetical protein
LFTFSFGARLEKAFVGCEDSNALLWSMGMKGFPIFLEKSPKNKVTSMSIFPAGVFINTILKTWQKGLIPLLSLTVPASNKNVQWPCSDLSPGLLLCAGLFSAFFYGTFLAVLHARTLYSTFLAGVRGEAAKFCNIFKRLFCCCWQISYQARKFFKK